MKVKALKKALSNLPDEADVLTGLLTEDHIHTCETKVLISKDEGEEGIFIGIDVKGLESINDDLKFFQE